MQSVTDLSEYLKRGLFLKRENNSNKRYLLIDGIRGFAIINMVIFHFLYDVYIIYEENAAWYSLPHIHIWQQAICWTFIFVSGFVWQLGIENNFRRGIFFNICGIAISLITWRIIPTEAIWFGILNFMGCAILLTIPLHNIMRKVPPTIGMLLSFIIFILSKNIQKGFVGMSGVIFLTLPRAFYNIRILTPFGFPYPGFKSSDYFPIFPWLFLFFTGYYFYLIFDQNELWKRTACIKIPLLSKFGGRTIWIYLVHQPISMAFCTLLFH